MLVKARLFSTSRLFFSPICDRLLSVEAVGRNEVEKTQAHCVVPSAQLVTALRR